MMGYPSGDGREGRDEPDVRSDPAEARKPARRARSRRRELQRANQELRRRVDELETLFGIAPVGLAIARDPECRHIEANPMFRRLLRLRADDNASRTAPPDERPNHFRVLQDDGVEIPPEQLPMQLCARSGVPVNGSECHVVFEDGSVIDLLGSSAPLFDEAARPRGCIGAFLDVTQWKRAAAELAEARAAAESASRAKDRFIAVLSHELRGPLSPIVATMELWNVAGADALPADLREDVEVIRRNVAALTRLIDDLLDSTAISTGKLVLRVRPVDLHESLRQCLDAHRGRAEAKGLDLRFRPAARHVLVEGDRQRLDQVFGNLLRNAIKFTRDGHIEVTTDDVAAGGGDLDAAPGRIRVHVRDTGIGIAAGVSPTSLLDPFEQGGDDMARRFGGLGLGLSICRGLIHAHGGHIAVASDGLGKGTTVTVDLPVLHSGK